jgi:Tol biopolymer transport system component
MRRLLLNLFAAMVSSRPNHALGFSQFFVHGNTGALALLAQRWTFSLRHCGAPLPAAFALLAVTLNTAHGAETRRLDRFVFDSNRTGNFEIFRMESGRPEPTQLTSDRAYDNFWPKPSPDGKSILFVRSPAGVHDTNYRKVTTWTMHADGSGVRQILPPGAHGWSIQGHPEWKPDGTKIVTIGGASHNAQVFIVNPDGSQPFRVTSNGEGGARAGMNLDSSWHPDGKSLLFIGCPAAFCLPSSYEVYRIDADGSKETRLTHDSLADYDPYYSPSGKQIAWLRSISRARWAIYRMAADGSGQQPVIDDGGINSKPAWQRDGSAIVFHRIPPNAPAGSFFNIWRITADGKDLTEVIRPRPAYVNEYPALEIR